MRDVSLADFCESFNSAFPVYVEHLVVGWYLSNAKAECLSTEFVLPNMLWMNGDFAQNIQVNKRWETAEEFFKRPEIAMHGIISGFVSATDGKSHEMTHVATSDYR